jgi:hypothetical protein
MRRPKRFFASEFVSNIVHKVRSIVRSHLTAINQQTN